MARIVVAGGGVVGASIAYHLARKGARDVVLAEAGRIASGASGKALGGVRQQFSSAPEVRLARESVAFFHELGGGLFEAVGYLFLATSEAGLAELEKRRSLQAGLGVPVVKIDPAFVDGLAVEDVLGAVFCAEDGTADPAGVTHELVHRAAALGVEVLEQVDALTQKPTCSCSRQGRRPRRSEEDSASSCPCDRWCDSSSRLGRFRAYPQASR